GGAVVWLGRAPTPPAPPPLPPVAGAQPVAPPPVPRPAPVEAQRWTADRDIRLSARRHAFSLPASHAARIRLDPARTYRAWVDPAEGDPPAVFAQAEGGALAELGTRAEEALRVSGASAFYAWTLVEAGSARTVRLQPVDAAPVPSTLRVEPRRHGLRAATLASLHLTGLDPSARYLVTLEGSGSPGAALALSEGPGAAAAGLLTAGSPLALSGASALRLALPDDRLDDNTGEFAVKILPKN
ncbi:MAG: hypothetical protein FJ086_15590, partial [Deltaproteobacteria bacterium]|nr:hypothetical protein [Deltaproteobacteria bacterium]